MSLYDVKYRVDLFTLLLLNSYNMSFPEQDNV